MSVKRTCWFRMRRLLDDMSFHGFISEADRKFWASEIVKINKLMTHDAYEDVLLAINATEENYFSSIELRKHARAA